LEHDKEIVRKDLNRIAEGIEDVIADTREIEEYLGSLISAIKAADYSPELEQIHASLDSVSRNLEILNKTLAGVDFNRMITATENLSEAIFCASLTQPTRRKYKKQTQRIESLPSGADRSHIKPRRLTGEE